MKDPAMLFYASDFLTGVAFLTMAERGQYITLLCLQQQHGHLTAQEIRAAVGRVSRNVLDKFERDENGKFYNRRAELEIEKRRSHSEKQRENVLKRWNKKETSEDIPKTYHGTNDGITVVDTTVIPLENENEILNISSSQVKKELSLDTSTGMEEIIPARAREDVGKNDPLLADFMAKLLDSFGSVSRGAAEEALAWYKALGGELCGHAVDVALDNGKRSWSYVRGILSRYEAEGLKTLDAVLADERARAEKKGGDKRAGISGNHTGEAAQGNGRGARRFAVHVDNAVPG